jgi:cytoskeletal protein RodZ
MAAFGEKLRREREGRGVPIEAICETTKLSVRYIRAIEDGQFGEMPGGVFRRGFLRSYLDALGLDVAIWMRLFEQSCVESGINEPNESGWVAFAENVSSRRPGLRRRKTLKWLGVAAMVVGVLIAGWCCWRLVAHQGSRSAGTAKLAPSIDGKKLPG